MKKTNIIKHQKIKHEFSPPHTSRQHTIQTNFWGIFKKYLHEKNRVIVFEWFYRNQ